MHLDSKFKKAYKKPKKNILIYLTLLNSYFLSFKLIACKNIKLSIPY